MRLYTLADEYTDADLEQRTLAALHADSARFWQYQSALEGTFRVEQATWDELARAIEEERTLALPVEWQPAEDLDAAVVRLVDLRRRRQVAAAVERVSQGLRDSQTSANELAALMETEALRVQGELREVEGTARSAVDVLKQVLADAELRSEQRRTTGRPVMGLSTGIGSLDLMLNGLMAGRQYVLAGPPGMGKTTLATQWMEKAARARTPVVRIPRPACCRSSSAPARASTPRRSSAAWTMRTPLDSGLPPSSSPRLWRTLRCSRVSRS